MRYNAVENCITLNTCPRKYVPPIHFTKRGRVLASRLISNLKKPNLAFDAFYPHNTSVRKCSSYVIKAPPMMPSFSNPTTVPSDMKIKGQTSCCNESGQSLTICVIIAVASSLSFTLFASNNQSIPTPAGNKHHDKSEGSNEAVDEAREVERRRAREELYRDPGPKPKKVAYVVLNGRSLGIFNSW